MTENRNISKLAVLDGFYLKLIAVVTMIIDHVGMVFFSNDMTWRIIGRISFPIYCFLLVEGFFHTKNIGRYIGRLAVFAIISEIPFDLVVSKRLVDFTGQNVFFTLLIGLLTIYFINRTFNEISKTIVLVLGMLVSIILLTDYTCYGVMLIYIFYYLRDRRGLACVGVALMGLAMGRIQWFAALAAIPIMMYNGKKGPKVADNVVFKYGFYLIYPVHLLVLWMI